LIIIRDHYAEPGNDAKIGPLPDENNPEPKQFIFKILHSMQNKKVLLSGNIQSGIYFLYHGRHTGSRTKEELFKCLWISRAKLASMVSYELGRKGVWSTRLAENLVQDVFAEWLNDVPD
jgi:hypothetical protein